MIWTDATSYNRLDKERKPNVLSCKLTEKISFLVHKHIYYGNDWLLSCRYLDVERLQLGTTDMEEAKALGLKKMTDLLRSKRNEIDDAISELVWSTEEQV